MRNPKQFLAGFISGIIGVFLVAFLVLASGALDLSASNKPGSIEKTLVPWALERSLARRAPKKNNPFANDASASGAGMSHYREDCLICHGAPHIAASEFSMGLNPPAPALESKAVQGLSDSELFWIVKNGVRWSGMPAFGPSHSDTEIWKIASFLRHLPHLTPEEMEELKGGTERNANHSTAQTLQRPAESGMKTNLEH